MSRPFVADKEEIIKMYESGMVVQDIADAVGLCRQSVYRYLKDHPKGRNGGVVARTIPKYEIFKSAAKAVEAIAEKNADNASVILESCNISLGGCVGSYTLNTQKKEVRCEIGDNVFYFKFDDLLGLIDELKGVGRCIKHFDIGNVMW